MTIREKNIAIAKFCGIKPRKMWQYWFDKEAGSGTTYLKSKEDAEASRIQQTKIMSDLGFYDEFSEVEEYDDWSHVPNYFINLNEVRKAELLAGIESETAEERAEKLGKILNLW